MLVPFSDTRLFCSIRKKWVNSLPEEKVRQRLIYDMIHRLGYPPGLIVLEKKLSTLPHLSKTPSVPNRRADLIVFAKNLHPADLLSPLLLVECKAIPLTPSVLRQIVGYNQFVGACFIGVVNASQFLLGWFEPSQKEFSFLNELPSYESLLFRAFENRKQILN